MKYEDFVIQFGQLTAKGYEVRVTSPAGEAEGYFIPPFNDEEMVISLTELGRRGVQNRDLTYVTRAWFRELGGSPEPVQLTPHQIGESLFRALFSGELVGRLDQSLGKIGCDPGLGLRLKFKLNPRHPDLARIFSLPWEFLFRPSSQDYFSLSRTTPIVRYLDVPRPAEPLALPDHLRILVVVGGHGGPELDLERELASLLETWKDHPYVEVVLLPRASLSLLRRYLLEGLYHVLHYMGHGSFDVESGEGCLYFESEQGAPVAVSGHALATHLKDFTDLRLIFLNACRSGTASDQGGFNPFAGVAGALIMGGFPAVLAMQFPISDHVAIAFSKAFYQRLAEGDEVESAVVEGRLAIHGLDERGTEWGTPVLFSRVPSGKLFHASPKTLLGDLPVTPAVLAKTSTFQRPPARAGFRLTRLLIPLLILMMIAAYCLSPLSIMKDGPQLEPAKTVEKKNLPTKQVDPKPSNKTHKVGDTSDITLPGGAEMTMVWIPPGRFTMGSPASETEWRNDEDQLEVKISKGFWMSITEVTQAQWQSVMRTNPSHFRDVTRPVEQVSWSDAKRFVDKLNANAGARLFSLPTEAQWEYACRAGSGKRFAGPLEDMAWFSNNGKSQTHPVAQKQANDWGLYDMHGNVWEWCSDWKAAYPSGTVSDPKGPAQGSFKAARGGSYRDHSAGCRAANRWGLSYQGGQQNVGFRVLRTDD